MKKIGAFLFIVSCCVACSEVSPAKRDNGLPEYLDVEISFSREGVYEKHDYPGCSDTPEGSPRVYEYSMKTYIAVESLFGQYKDDYQERDDSLRITLPHTFRYRVKREEDRVLNMHLYWDWGIKECTQYYHRFVVKIQGIVVVNDVQYVNGGVVYQEVLPYSKEDFELLKAGKWERR